MNELARTDDQINEQLDKAAEVLSNGTYSGSAYARGVDAALRWAFGWNDNAPMED